MGDEIAFLAADKHKSFLKVGVITLDVHSQACPIYSKQQLYKSLQYLKENTKMKVDFSPAEQHQSFFKVDTIILGLCG